MSKRRFELVFMSALAVILVPGLLQAGEVQVGGQGGGPPGDLCDQQEEDCEVLVDWNPKVDCNDKNDLDILLDCMLNEEQEAASDFESELLPGDPDGPWGVGIQRVIPAIPGYKVEIQRLRIFETVRGIQTTQVTVNQPDRVARILKIIEGPDPVGVKVVIELDDDHIEFEDQEEPPLDEDLVVWREEFPTLGHTALDVNVAIYAWLIASGFTVQDDGDAFVVSRDGGFRRLQFLCDDPSYIASDIALVPKNDPLVGHLFFNKGGGF